MRYEAATLDEVYEQLAELVGPLAVFDFLSGEMGYEALCAQAIGGKFWDEHHKGKTVVALCWKGCTAYYENVSHVQIELVDGKFSTLGNQMHRGDKRWATLVLANHREKVKAIKGISAHIGPGYWSGGRVIDQRLCGFVNYRYLWEYGHETNRTGIIAATTRRLLREEYTFKAKRPLVEQPYLALFDRNEKPSKDRNTQDWQIGLFRHWAKKFNLRLVVVSGFRPRNLPDDVIQLTMEFRDVELLRRISRNALVYGAPPCGAAEVACILGCNFVALGHLGLGHDDLVRTVARCDHRYFGILDDPKGATARTVHDYLRQSLAEKNDDVEHSDDDEK